LRIPGLRRWAALVASAAAVAVATGVFYLALAIPLSEPGWADVADRRVARPELRPDRFEIPLERLSKNHVAIAARARARNGDAGTGSEHGIRVLLDTGQSVAITTPDAEQVFGLRVGAGTAIVGRGISGDPTELLPIRESQSLFLSIAPFDSPNSVATPVRHLGVDRLEGTQAVVPPQLLGPFGGAVRLDLARNLFATCETLASCRDGGEWVRVTGAPCKAYPDLVIVSAALSGTSARFLLDTGGVTLVAAKFFDALRLEKDATVGAGSLVVSGGKSLASRVATGAFPLELGADRSAKRIARTLWVPTELGGATARCNLDGAIGVDVLNGCELVLTATTPSEAFVKCE
jgi:hypothetical protein